MLPGFFNRERLLGDPGKAANQVANDLKTKQNSVSMGQAVQAYGTHQQSITGKQRVTVTEPLDPAAAQ
ncbi:hypothetical protein D3C85_1444260 [compost metagenome]